jgi:hypothetical protein
VYYGNIAPDIALIYINIINHLAHHDMHIRHHKHGLLQAQEL